MKKYVYESPDGGKTVYRREHGTTKRIRMTGKKFKFSFQK